MDYEKKYKEALKKAKDYHKQLINEDNPEWASEIENIFPELVESEDERIRKALIDFFDDANKCEENPMYEYGIHTDEILAWLEKQSPKPKCGEEDSLMKENNNLWLKKQGKQKTFDYENADVKQKDFAPLEVDGFDAELNALLKKYEHLSKKELQEPLEFYLGVVRDDLDIVREEKPKWTGADDYNVQCCIAKIENDIAKGRLGRNKELIEWLQSLKQRMEKQQCDNKLKQNDYEQGYNDAIDKTCKFLNDKLPFYWALADVSNTDKFINLFIKTIKERQ